MAIATAGFSVIVAIVVSLISYLNSASEATSKYAEETRKLEEEQLRENELLINNNEQIKESYDDRIKAKQREIDLLIAENASKLKINAAEKELLEIKGGQAKVIMFNAKQAEDDRKTTEIHLQGLKNSLEFLEHNAELNKDIIANTKLQIKSDEQQLQIARQYKDAKQQLLDTDNGILINAAKRKQIEAGIAKAAKERLPQAQNDFDHMAALEERKDKHQQELLKENERLIKEDSDKQIEAAKKVADAKIKLEADAAQKTQDEIARNRQIDLDLKEKYKLSYEQIDKEYLAFQKETGKTGYEDFKKWEDAKQAEAKKKQEDLKKTMAEIQKTSTQVIHAMGEIAGAVFAQATQRLQQQFQTATAELDKWHEHAIEGAHGNAKKEAAIAKLYAAQQLKLKHEHAIKEAEIKRKQAEYNKAAKIIEIGIETAVSIVKASPAIPLMVMAAATGAISLATAIAQPLPAIPKFATGVIGFQGQGTETSDSNIVAISTGESIIKASSTKRYEAELDAIQNMQFESLVMDKYILPFLKATGKATATGADYDDWLLRKDVREGNRAIKKSAEYIVKGVSEAVKTNGYINSRYHA